MKIPILITGIVILTVGISIITMAYTDLERSRAIEANPSILPHEDFTAKSLEGLQEQSVQSAKIGMLQDVANQGIIITAIGTGIIVYRFVAKPKPKA